MVDFMLRVVLDAYDGCDMWKYSPQCCGTEAGAADTMAGMVGNEKGVAGWEPDKQQPNDNQDGEQMQETSGSIVDESKGHKEVDHLVLLGEFPTATRGPVEEPRFPYSSAADRDGDRCEARENAESADDAFVPGSEQNDENRVREPSVGVEGEGKQGSEREGATGVGAPSMQKKNEEQDMKNAEEEEEGAVEFTLSETKLASEKCAPRAEKDVNMPSPPLPLNQKMSLGGVSSEASNINDERDEAPIENLSSLTYSLGEYAHEEDTGFGLIPEVETSNKALRSTTGSFASHHLAGSALPPKVPRSAELTAQKDSSSVLTEGRAGSPNASASDPDVEGDHFSAKKSFSGSPKSMDNTQVHGEVIGLSALDGQRGEAYLSSCTSGSHSGEDNGLQQRLFANTATSPTTISRALSPNSQDRQSYFSPTHSSNPSYISSTSSSSEEFEDALGTILENISSLSHKASELSDQATESPWNSHNDALFSITDDNNVGTTPAASKHEGKDADTRKGSTLLPPSWNSKSPDQGLDESIGFILETSSSSFEGGKSMFRGEVMKDPDQAMSDPLRSALDELKIIEGDSFEYDKVETKSTQSTTARGRDLIKAAEEAISRFSAVTSSTEFDTSMQTNNDTRDDAVNDDREVNDGQAVEQGAVCIEREGTESDMLERNQIDCKESKQAKTSQTLLSEFDGDDDDDDTKALPFMNGTTSAENVSFDFEESSPFTLQLTACKDVKDSSENEAQNTADVDTMQDEVSLLKSTNAEQRSPAKGIQGHGMMDVVKGHKGSPRENSHRRVVSCDGKEMKMISLTLQSESQIDSIFRSASRSPSSTRSLPDIARHGINREEAYPISNVSDLAQEGTKEGDAILIQPDKEMNSIFIELSSSASPRERSLTGVDLSDGGISSRVVMRHNEQQHSDMIDEGPTSNYDSAGVSANKEHLESISDASANEEYFKPIHNLNTESDHDGISQADSTTQKLTREYQERVNEIRQQYNSKLEQLKREMDQEIQRQSVLLKQSIRKDVLASSTVLGSNDEPEDSTYGKCSFVVQEKEGHDRDGLPSSEENNLNTAVSETKRRKSAIEERMNRLLKNAAHESCMIPRGEDDSRSEDLTAVTQNSSRSEVSETKRMRKEAMEKRLHNLLKSIHSPRNDTGNIDAEKQVFHQERIAEESNETPDSTFPFDKWDHLRKLPQSNDETEGVVESVSVARQYSSDDDQSPEETLKRTKRQYIEEMTSLQVELKRKLQDERDSLQHSYENMTKAQLHKEEEGDDDVAEKVRLLEGEILSNRESHRDELEQIRIDHKAEVDKTAKKLVHAKSEYETRRSEIQGDQTQRDETIAALNKRIKDAYHKEKTIRDQRPELTESLKRAEEESMDTKEKVQGLTQMIEQLKLERKKQLENEPAKLQACRNKVTADITAAIDRQYAVGNKKLEALQKENSKVLDRMEALKKLHGIKQSSGDTIKQEGEQRLEMLQEELQNLKAAASVAEEKSRRQTDSLLEKTSSIKESLDELESALSDMKQYAADTEMHKNKALTEAAELRMENSELEGWCKELMSILSSTEQNEEEGA